MRPSKFRKQLRHIQKHSRIFLNIKWLYWTSLYVFRKVKNMFFRLKITVITVNVLVLSTGAALVCKYDENCNNNYSKWPTAKLVYQKITAHLPEFMWTKKRATKRQICYVTDVTRDVSDDTGVNVSDVTAWDHVTKRDVICVALTSFSSFIFKCLLASLFFFKHLNSISTLWRNKSICLSCFFPQT